MIRTKPGVSLDNVHPRIFLAIGLAAPVWARYGSSDFWITGANEDGHSTGPRGFHRLPNGTCQAIDARTWTIKEPEHRRMACKELAGILGPDFDVIFEEEVRDASGKIIKGEHAHIQLDEERPGTR